jgi:hypothetical protein
VLVCLPKETNDNELSKKLCKSKMFGTVSGTDTGGGTGAFVHTISPFISRDFSPNGGYLSVNVNTCILCCQSGEKERKVDQLVTELGLLIANVSLVYCSTCSGWSVANS